MLFSRARPRVSCHFCNEQLSLVSHTNGKGKERQRDADGHLAFGTQLDFTCSVCDQRNLRTEDGELVSSMPAMHASDLNKLSFERRASPGPSLTGPSFARTPLCRSCISNASLQVHLLAAFPDSDDDEDDPDSIPHLLPEYRASLDHRYPLVCGNCQGAVDDILQQADYRAKAYALGARLRESQRGGPERRNKGRGKRRKDAPWKWAAMGWAWRVRGAAFWTTHLLGLLLAGFGAATPSALVAPPSREDLLSWIPTVCVISLLWAFWDPTWNHMRNELARGRHPRVDGRQLFIYIQVAAYFWRIVVAVTFSRRLIADASIVRNVLFATFLVFLSAFLAAFLAIRIHDPVIVRLTSRPLLAHPTPSPSSDPYQAALGPLESLSISPYRLSPHSTPRQCSSPRPPPTQAAPQPGGPAFGRPAFAPLTAEDEMDWEPAVRAREEIVLGPQRFFAPVKPSGLEDIFEKGLRMVDGDDMAVDGKERKRWWKEWV